MIWDGWDILLVKVFTWRTYKDPLNQCLEQVPIGMLLSHFSGVLAGTNLFEK